MGNAPTTQVTTLSEDQLNDVLKDLPIYGIYEKIKEDKKANNKHDKHCENIKSHNSQCDQYLIAFCKKFASRLENLSNYLSKGQTHADACSHLTYLTYGEIKDIFDSYKCPYEKKYFIDKINEAIIHINNSVSTHKVCYIDINYAFEESTLKKRLHDYFKNFDTISENISKNNKYQCHLFYFDYLKYISTIYDKFRDDCCVYYGLQNHCSSYFHCDDAYRPQNLLSELYKYCIREPLLFNLKKDINKSANDLKNLLNLLKDESYEGVHLQTIKISTDPKIPDLSSATDYKYIRCYNITHPDYDSVKRCYSVKTPKNEDFDKVFKFVNQEQYTPAKPITKRKKLKDNRLLLQSNKQIEMQNGSSDAVTTDVNAKLNDNKNVEKETNNNSENKPPKKDELQTYGNVKMTTHISYDNSYHLEAYNIYQSLPMRIIITSILVLGIIFLTFFTPFGPWLRKRLHKEREIRKKNLKNKHHTPNRNRSKLKKENMQNTRVRLSYTQEQ
ncbi:variable surface protein [Plasmodium gonderi]|uniref:Variable surface protein n=1 Tax=Plasmodium gonderi TaxID=77519 RepID=A0A1Y1JVJ3_PLAGO|nr:variable surface protein [Plasmodium gonderi]GAW83914.1 variable surface protein [Plasmodium gonderi]